MGKLMGVEQLFEGRHFDREVIILCVRWYLRFKLSLRDLVGVTMGIIGRHVLATGGAVRRRKGWCKRRPAGGSAGGRRAEMTDG
jgi:hypothetical protein